MHRPVRVGLAAALLTSALAAPAARAGVPAAQAPAPTGASVPTGCAAAHLSAPTVVTGHGNVQAFVLQYRQSVPAMATYASITSYVNCWFASYVAPYRDRHVPGLVVFNELTGLAFGLEGSRGAAARAFAGTPAATAPGRQTNEPLGALGGALGMLGAAYAAPLAYYAARFPTATAAEVAGDVATLTAGGLRVPADRVFLAITDTEVRAFVATFAALARRYQVSVVAGAELPVLTSESACRARGYPGWPACPGWAATSEPAAVAALGDPDLAGAYASGRLHTVYQAVTSQVLNAAWFFDPAGRLYAVQPKVNLTPVERELGWAPAPPSTIHAVALRATHGRAVPGVRLGVAISLDAFEHAESAHPCRTPTAYLRCLDDQGVNVLVQPEFNDGVAACASWSDYSPACLTTPVWQPLDWMMSSWYDLRARRAGRRWLYPHLRYALNAFMVGNLYDLTGDGQSAIVARADPRARTAAYAGDVDTERYLTDGPYGPYPDPLTVAPESSPLAPMTYRELDGAQQGFLAITPWVLTGSDPAGGVRDRPALPAGDPGSLESCTDGLVPGSGVSGGTCAQNAYRASAIVAELRLPWR